MPTDRTEHLELRLGPPVGQPAVTRPPIVTTHLTESEVAQRWRLSVKTLQRWRWHKQGPAYLKIGSHVVYRLHDIEAFEAERLRQPERRQLLGTWR